MSYLECEKCGGRYELREGESPDDFESCECGGKLRHVHPQITPIKKQRMKFTTKILIGIVIVLVLVVGIAAGMILMSKEPVANNTTDNTTTNNTTVTVNNSSSGTTKTTTTSNSNDKVMISAKEAEQIATKTLSGYDVRGTGASLSEGNGHPVWIVYLKNPDGSSAGQCAVDATTGEFLG